MFKLSAWVWLVCGVFIGLTILSYAYFQFYGPDTLEAEYTNDYVQKLEAQGAKLGAAKQRVERAQARVEEIADRWRQVSDAKVRNGFIDLNQDPLELTLAAQSYRNKVQSAVNRQMKVGGVTVVNGPEVERPSNDPTSLLTTYFNVNRLPFPAVIFELGTVTVRGTFGQIAANMQGWTNMPDYFAVADGLTITGTSPELTATYAVTIVGFLPGQVSGPLAGSVVTGAEGTGTGNGQGGGPGQNQPTGSGGASGGGKVLPGANTPTGAGG